MFRALTVAPEGQGELGEAQRCRVGEHVVWSATAWTPECSRGGSQREAEPRPGGKSPRPRRPAGHMPLTKGPMVQHGYESCPVTAALTPHTGTSI